MTSFGSVTIAGSSFTRNTAEEAGDSLNDGGAIANFGRITLDNIVTQGDKADNGGTIYNEGTLTVLNSTLTTGSANENGGGLYNLGTATFGSSDIRFNTAISNGGGIYNDGFLTITETNMFANVARENGGGLYSNGSNDFDYLGGRIYSNTARNGGGLYTLNTTLLIDGVEVYDNSAEISGGGFVHLHASGTVRNSSFYSNSAELGIGGGIYALTNSGFRYQNLDIYNNQAVDGGGVAFFNDGILEDSRIYNNAAQIGGGLYTDGEATVSNSYIYSNSATIVGGGIYMSRQFCLSCPRRLLVERSTVAYNSAPEGGGFAGATGTVEFENSTFSHNTGSGIATDFGFIDPLTMTLRHTTVAFNTPYGIFGFDSTDDSLTVRNSLIGSNDTDCQLSILLPVTVEGNNLSSDGSCAPFDLAGDPQLAPFANNGGTVPNHLPAQSSPAVDVGLSLCASKDQRGFGRINSDGNGNPNDGNPCDLGAIERQSSIPTAVVLSEQLSEHRNPSFTGWTVALLGVLTISFGRFTIAQKQ